MSINHKKSRQLIFLNLSHFFLFMRLRAHDEVENKTWSSYLGDKAVSHYSSLNEIDTSNVQQLKVAWEYHTGDANPTASSQIQCNPDHRRRCFIWHFAPIKIICPGCGYRSSKMGI